MSQPFTLKWIDPVSGEECRSEGDVTSLCILASQVLHEGCKLVTIYDSAYLIECDMDRAEVRDRVSDLKDRIDRLTKSP